MSKRDGGISGLVRRVPSGGNVLQEQMGTKMRADRQAFRNSETTRYERAMEDYNNRRQLTIEAIAERMVEICSSTPPDDDPDFGQRVQDMMPVVVALTDLQDDTPPTKPCWDAHGNRVSGSYELEIGDTLGRRSNG